MVRVWIVQPWGCRLFRGIVKAHDRQLNRTIMVKNNDVEEAMKIMNKMLSNEGLLDIMKRARFYETGSNRRHRVSYEIAKAVYDEEMRRKISFVSRKLRKEPYPFTYG